MGTVPNVEFKAFASSPIDFSFSYHSGQYTSDKLYWCAVFPCQSGFLFDNGPLWRNQYITNIRHFLSVSHIYFYVIFWIQCSIISLVLLQIFSPIAGGISNTQSYAVFILYSYRKHLEEINAKGSSDGSLFHTRFTFYHSALWTSLFLTGK